MESNQTKTKKEVKMLASVIYVGDNTFPSHATVKFFELRVGDQVLGVYNDPQKALAARDEFNSK